MRSRLRLYRPLPPPSSSASGTLNPSMVDNNTNIPLSDNILLPIADNGLGSIVAKQSARPPIQRPDNVGKESNKNPMNLPSPPPWASLKTIPHPKVCEKKKLRKDWEEWPSTLTLLTPPPDAKKKKTPPKIPRLRVKKGKVKIAKKM